MVWVMGGMTPKPLQGSIGLSYLSSDFTPEPEKVYRENKDVHPRAIWKINSGGCIPNPPPPPEQESIPCATGHAGHPSAPTVPASYARRKSLERLTDAHQCAVALPQNSPFQRYVQPATPMTAHAIHSADLLCDHPRAILRPHEDDGLACQMQVEAFAGDGGLGHAGYTGSINRNRATKPKFIFDC